MSTPQEPASTIPELKIPPGAKHILLAYDRNFISDGERRNLIDAGRALGVEFVIVRSFFPLGSTPLMLWDLDNKRAPFPSMIVIFRGARA
jgi:hypothetical protein